MGFKDLISSDTALMGISAVTFVFGGLGVTIAGFTTSNSYWGGGLCCTCFGHVSFHFAAQFFTLTCEFIAPITTTGSFHLSASADRPDVHRAHRLHIYLCAQEKCKILSARLASAIFGIASPILLSFFFSFFLF